MPSDVLIAKFPIEKGSIVRAIVEKHMRIFHSVGWEQEEALHSVKFTGQLARPDTDDEGSVGRFRYDADEVKTLMENEGASVVLQMPEFAA